MDNSRVKTDIRLPRWLVNDVEVITREIRISKSAFYSLAICQLVAAMVPVIVKGKAEDILNRLEKMFYDTVHDDRNRQ